MMYFAGLDWGSVEHAVRFIAEGLDLNPPPGYQPREAAAASTRTPAEARDRAGELQGNGCTYERIAGVLNSEGFRTARGKPRNSVSVGRMMRG